jgi:hypothetical protein
VAHGSADPTNSPVCNFQNTRAGTAKRGSTSHPELNRPTAVKLRENLANKRKNVKKFKSTDEWGSRQWHVVAGMWSLLAMIREREIHAHAIPLECGLGGALVFTPPMRYTPTDSGNCAL